MTNKDPYKCNGCGAELIAAASYCSQECKIKELRADNEKLKVRVTELEQQVLDMTPDWG